MDVVDMGGAVAELIRFVDEHRAGDAAPALVVTLNPEMVMRGRRDPRFRQTVESAALLVPDGIGIARALRRRGYPQAVRVGGADLLAAYMPHAARLGHRLALAGAGPGVAEEAARRLTASYPTLQVVATDAGSPDAAMAARLRDAHPDVVLAAFGAGLQELFLSRYLEAIDASAGIGVGGTIDYLSGRVRRAPALVQRAGLEWAWRLVRQPSRLRRQSVLPRFWLLERREAATVARRASARPRP
ncbi:MAG TPA: WecB/TagA/CpsF family glycosyltransferase [Candidatus Acidoferrales bacterium]|nr:WecB/TagA/CpsF family glycosyltransferase [Candidatus Acidoferrales bacterium]